MLINWLVKLLINWLVKMLINWLVRWITGSRGRAECSLWLRLIDFRVGRELKSIFPPTWLLTSLFSTFDPLLLAVSLSDRCFTSQAPSVTSGHWMGLFSLTNNSKPLMQFFCANFEKVFACWLIDNRLFCFHISLERWEESTFDFWEVLWSLTVTVLIQIRFSINFVGCHHRLSPLNCWRWVVGLKDLYH